MPELLTRPNPTEHPQPKRSLWSAVGWAGHPVPLPRDTLRPSGAGRKLAPTDRIHAYLRLWRLGNVVPEAVVVQNHGKNGLWTPLDDDCRLYACAPILPRFLYVGDIGSQPWPHYHQVSREVVGRNSMHNSRRVLYECTLPNRINPDSPLQQWDGSSPRMASERYSGLGRMRMK